MFFLNNSTSYLLYGCELTSCCNSELHMKLYFGHSTRPGPLQTSVCTKEGIKTRTNNHALKEIRSHNRSVSAIKNDASDRAVTVIY
jgi:hypothetical protein